MASPQHGSLAARILPTRGAAQKASASFAEQLMDSPTHSDGERSEFGSPGPSNPFGEPSSHRTKSVKYRYSATGKHRSSPLKGNSSSPEHSSLGKAKQNVATKANPISMTSFTPAAPSNASKGKARAVASTSRKRKASASSLRREDALSSLSLSLSPSPLSSAPTSPIMSPNDHHLSPIPPLKGATLDLAKRLPVSKTLSMPSFAPTASKLGVFPHPLSPGRKLKRSKTNGKTSPDAWDVGSSVWVLVTDSGAVVDNTTHSDIEILEQLMWWPGQIVQKEPLRVSLFGEFPSSSSSSRGLCTIFAPSPSNIQSICDDTGSKRFTRTTFCISSFSADDDFAGPPPTKKPRLDESISVEERWESAVQSMEKASTLERDGLPALISSYASAGNSFYDSLDESDPDASDLRQSLRKPTGAYAKKSKPIESTRKLKAQRSRANIKDDASVDTSRSWSPCPPDPTLQIPGELVLAQAPKTGGSYWPAQLLEHVSGRKEKYKVKFLDDKEHIITRDKFWTSEEEGFVRCTLGEWESAIKTIEDPESGDEGEEDEDDGEADADDPNGSSLPLPPPADDFEDLSVREQLAYVKPVLRAILNKGYAPARKKHEAFMKGGSARVALLKAAGIRGGMDARFVKAVQKAICKWVLGGDGIRPKAMDVDVQAVAGVAEGENRVVEGSATQPIVPALESLETTDGNATQDDKMEGVEGGDMPQDTRTDHQVGNDAIPSTSSTSALDKQVEIVQDSEMVIDVPEQKSVLILDTTNDATASLASTNQISLGLKGQLDLLAEVSQAVANKPSLLPSHPELPSIKIDTSDAIRKDTSSQPSPLTPMPEEREPIVFVKGDQIGCDEFRSLSGVEKLDYCLNILLPESIQQLLLWRSGERTSPALLSPEEEQRLHDMGARKAAETDWVDDVMRLRAAQARLRGIDLSKKVEEKKSDVMAGGTRSRPRRETISR